ncbi:MAG: hypothetical protein A2V70_07120 [Planctomycetes bacterium RBG_13_63_9]|nr:MAG: hypothetical protein A2V70_07120 [Planctomycetes bacterium RBG_13_63_9]
MVVVLPLVVAAGKCSVFPTSDFLSRAVSLADVPVEMHRRLQYVLFVPLGAILVVLCRLTLGIRVLGPFRSILLALAFQITGILQGIAFLVVVVAAIVGIRPTLKAMRLPYFGRVSVILSLVSVIIVFAMLLASWVEVESLRRVAYFPLIVLCLVGDSFSRILVKEGPRSALWRGTMTILVGVLLTCLAAMPVLRQLLLDYPELLIAQIGCIVVVCEFLDWRLLQWMNPAVDNSEEPEENVKSNESDGMNVAA